MRGGAGARVQRFGEDRCPSLGTWFRAWFSAWFSAWFRRARALTDGDAGGGHQRTACTECERTNAATTRANDARAPGRPASPGSQVRG